MGKLDAVYPLAPAQVQRAAFIAALSFLFFLGTMLLFYLRGSLLYFLLASAFLVVYGIMMLSWLVQRKNVVRVFERGLTYRGRQAMWDEITGVADDGTISVNDEKPILISPAINDLPGLLTLIRSRSGNR